jgi:hypothetical protein
VRLNWGYRIVRSYLDKREIDGAVGLFGVVYSGGLIKDHRFQLRNARKKPETREDLLRGASLSAPEHFL